MNLETLKKIKKHSRLKLINGFSTLSGTVLSISGGIISSTGLGVISGGPMIGISSLFCSYSLISLKYDNNNMIKLIKYEKLISLCFAKLFSIQDKISKALNDGKISDEEFRLVSEDDRNYELQRSDILKKEKK